jgi:long-chain acyl-CoA synthetase
MLVPKETSVGIFAHLVNRERAKMTNTPWLVHYPSDVPKQLPPISFSNLPELLRTAVQTYDKKVAFTQVMPNGMNGSLTYRQVDELSDQFASYLREELKLSAGDRVAVQMPNCLSYPVVAFGVFKAGCVLVNTNPLYTATEMIHQFSDSGATTLVVIDMFADRLPEVLGKTNIKNVVVVKISEYFPSVVGGVIRLVQKVWSRTLPKIEVEHTRFAKAIELGKAKQSKEQAAGYLSGVTNETVAALQYTGGTTGVSKGAMLSHGNLVANTLQMIAHCGDGMRAGKETVLTALPLYHIFAFTVNLLGFFHNGARNILIPSPRPPSNLQRAFDNYKVTWLSGVNTLFNALLNERWFQDSPPKHLRASAAGGMALQASVAERWRKLTGTPIVEGYGLTESSPVLTFNLLTGLAKDGSIGIPIPSTEVKCVDENGKDVAVGEAGEIIARGPQIMLGYWQRPDETAKTLKDGWLYTGDIAQMDADGFFTIVDRKKDMILVSGFNVYPNEIEEQIAAVPGVLEVGVIGVPDEKTGERIQAYVKAVVPPPSREQIIAHCRNALAAYKIPQDVIFIDELPKSPIGKILRRELRDQAIKSKSGNASKGA